MSLSLVARVVLPGLWTECDDQGLFAWKPLTLKARILPADNADMAAILNELKTAGFLCSFLHDGKEFGAVRNFRKFQRPKKPTNVHFLPTELRTYVGLPDESSPLLPHQLPTEGEIPPQMEDGGGKMEEGRSAPPTAAPPKPKAKSRRSLPEGFPFQPDQDWAMEHWLKRGRVDICDAMTEEIEKFRDHHTANATMSADWSGSWRTWTRNAMNFNRRNSGTPHGKRSANDKFLAAAESLVGEFLECAEGGDDSGFTNQAGRPLLPA